MTLRVSTMLCVLAAIPMPAAAQSSTGFRIADQVFNNGGGPGENVPPSSAAFRISLDSIGATVGVTQASSLGFQLQGSFIVTYRPPGEVLGLGFTDPITMAWLPEPSVGYYDIYRSEVSQLALGNTGVCLAAHVSENFVYESFDPAPGHAWFYLVTANNRLDEEGTKGYRSNGTQRPNPSPCP